jgi:hypothetical protein
MLFAIFLLAGAVGVAAALSSSSSSSSTSKGKAGGLGFFDGKAYSDESISEGELAEAASHGDKAASDELAKRQVKKWGDLADDALGTGSTIADEAVEGYGLAKSINDAVSKDLAADANTPEQKARLAAAVAKVVTLGYPPTRFAFLNEFGVEDQAAIIERDIDFIEHAPIALAPFMGTMDYAKIAQQIGQAAIVAAGRAQGDLLKATFLQMANRRSPFGFFGSFRAIDLIDVPPTGANLSSARRSPDQNPLYTALVYVASAVAGRFDMPRDKVLEIVAATSAGFPARHGLMSRADALSTSPEMTGILGPNGPTAAGAVCCEAWFGVLYYAQKNGIVDQMPDKPVFSPHVDVRLMIPR